MEGHRMLKLGHIGGGGGMLGSSRIGGGRGIGSVGIGKSGILPPLKCRTTFPQLLNRANSFSILEPFIASVSGPENECGTDVHESTFTPLTSTENLPFCDSPFNHSRLRGRRSSMPYDIPAFETNQEPTFVKEQLEMGQVFMHYSSNC
ncbi:hypothetical protein SK128_025820 [Halocaridina rubra]|uniref:Uncharacterized protein n=1 Tax=Halocaridina rubra TaxID=373956 RepID=A0AAN8WM49_HALRR